MARRRRGRPVDGWLVIDKPLEVTSTQVVGRVRWALEAQKAGHAGTLDPLATGLLAIALGEATKTVAVAQEGLKTYRFTVRLGAETATDDAEGAVTATSDLRPGDAEIAAALAPFRGWIEQVPPSFSAVKVAGERAYDLAREGERVDLAPRPLWVERLELLGRPDPDLTELELVCGKGGYVRSIARDLGRALGCLGHVAALRRTASGGFTLADATPWDSLEAIRGGDAAPNLLPVAAGLSGLPAVEVPAARAAQLRNGQPVPVSAHLDYGTQAWAAHAGLPVAIGTIRAGHLHPDRVIHAGSGTDPEPTGTDPRST